MAEHLAINASPIIFLARANLVELFQLVAPKLVVPATVATEIERRGPHDGAARALVETEWIEVVETSPVPARIQSWDLGPGESAVLSWCSAHPGTEGIIDDLQARRCAGTFQIPVRGTLGLVILGKNRGRFPAACPILEDLRRSGMCLSDQVLNRALKYVGE